MNIDRIEQHGFKLLDLVEETSRVYIWRAVQTTLDRSVFLVILNEETSADPLAIQYFLQIAQQFAKLKSESLAAIFDIVSEDDLHYVIMEYVDGETLDAILQSGASFDFKQLMQVALSVTGCLKQLWNTSRIIHRNIKGSTIRFDSRGIAKITDFSLAVIASPDFDIAVIDKGHVLGAPSFLAPEQARGDHVFTPCSDMYALGALLYYLSTGKAPFSELDAPEILSAHLVQQLTPPHLLNPAMPVIFSRLLYKLMMKAPEYRYQNWEELQHDLHCMVAHKEPVCARSDLIQLSTLKADFSEPQPDSEQPPTFKIKPRKRNQYLSSMQDRHVSQHHEADAKSQRRTAQLLWWGILVLWLALLFWYRSVLQVDPLKRQELREQGMKIGSAFEELIPAGQQAEITDSGPDLQSGTPSGAPLTAQAVSTEKLPPALLKTVAEALAANNLAQAITAAGAAGTGYTQQQELIALLRRVPSPDQMVAAYLRKNIGRPLIMNFKGAPRKVSPRSVSNQIVQLEANERAIDLDISTLSVEQKLNWIDPPATVEENIAAALLHLQSTNPAAAAGCAPGCGALAEAVEAAVKLRMQ